MADPPCAEISYLDRKYSCPWEHTVFILYVPSKIGSSLEEHLIYTPFCILHPSGSWGHTLGAYGIDAMKNKIGPKAHPKQMDPSKVFNWLSNFCCQKSEDGGELILRSRPFLLASPWTLPLCRILISAKHTISTFRHLSLSMASQDSTTHNGVITRLFS